MSASIASSASVPWCVLGQREPVDLVPLDLEQLTAAAREPSAGVGADGEPGDHPVAAAVLLDRASTMLATWPLSRTVTERSSSSASTRISFVRRSKRFMLTVPGRQHDLVGLDAGDPAHRHEDPVPMHHLDDQAEHARRLPVGAAAW